MAKRIFITGIWHETNTFAHGQTGLEDFRNYQYAEGDEVFALFADTNTEIGGVMNAAMELDLNLIPGLFAGAVPSGLVTAAAHETLVNRTLELLANAGEIDGVLVHLHGACVAEGATETDAQYLAAIRAALTPATPLVATFDLHANLSEGLVAQADALVGYDTYPHNDMAARGAEAAQILHRMLWSTRRPAKILRKLPFAPPPQMQGTGTEPVAAIMAKMHDMETWGGIWSASIAWGFPYADVAHLGVGVLVQGDDHGHATRLADDLAMTIWRQRGDFDAGLIAVEEAVRSAMAAPEGPIILVDVADNAGGGAPGDGTTILAELVDQSARNAVVVLCDGEAVRSAKALGVGAVFSGNVGGKSDDLHGPPMPLVGEIVFQERVRYQRRGDYMTGQRIDLGEVAVIQADGITVMLTEAKAMPFDADHLSAAGIVAETQQIIVVKSAIAWQAHFRTFAKGEIYVDTPGVCASNLKRFKYTKLDRAIYPIDNDGIWPAK
ncbi:MAG: M81 family metallopeptidase [Alphaproteobacteria bacterium]|nr:M81 family metallopeptidase [Alphaproteobacteria bacterium]